MARRINAESRVRMLVPDLSSNPTSRARVAVADHDQQADEKHARCRGDKVAWIPVFKSRTGLISQMGTERDCDGDATWPDRERERQRREGMLTRLLEGSWD